MEIQERPSIFPPSYSQKLGLRETEIAIKFIKDTFQGKLSKALNLTRVSAPVFVLSGTGVNDHLSGVEKPVSFTIRHTGEQAEVVQSLAKWKRKALADYGFGCGEGLYTDMNAIRPDEQLDNLHSVYVDQWDWESILRPEERNIGKLKAVVRSIYGVIRETEALVCGRYPAMEGPYLPGDIHFVHSEELEAAYPGLTPREREHRITADKGAVFVIGLGWPLSNGVPHDSRAADYDDWSTETGGGKRGLNGDILVWYPPLNRSFELSSMGIRVDPEALRRQLEMKGELSKLELDYHRRLVNGNLPLTVGGGIGQSRLCMLFLRKAHIGEVQSSVWPAEMVKAFREKNVFIL
jgi:aspartate--ammonia ligase